MPLAADLAAVAASEGLRASVMKTYSQYLQVAWVAVLFAAVPYARDRALADPYFLFKVSVESGVDAALAVVAECRRKAAEGATWWEEAHFGGADLVVGLVLDAAVVSLLAPAAKLGRLAPAASLLARSTATGPAKLLARCVAAAAELPPTLFAAAPQGLSYSLGARLMGFAWKSVQCGVVGGVAGATGQAVANAIHQRKSEQRKRVDPEYAAKVRTLQLPPLARTALVWALFAGASGNTRLQLVVGLERLVESLPVAKAVPLLPMACTLVLRSANLLVGGEQFVDLAAWAGV